MQWHAMACHGMQWHSDGVVVCSWAWCVSTRPIRRVFAHLCLNNRLNGRLLTHHAHGHTTMTPTACHVMPGIARHAIACRGMPWRAMTCMACHGMPWHAMARQGMPWHGRVCNPWHGMPCHGMPGTSSHAMACQCIPAAPKPGPRGPAKPVLSEGQTEPPPFPQSHPARERLERASLHASRCKFAKLGLQICSAICATIL